MTKMATTSFALIHSQVERKSDEASDICLVRLGDWATDPAAFDIKTL